MLTSLNVLLFFGPWLPVIDNVIVRGQLIDIVYNTSFPLKPLIICTITEECRDFIYGSWQKPITPSEYIGIALAIFQENAFKILKKYPPVGSDDQRSLVARAATQWMFGYPLDTENLRNWIQCSDHACHTDEIPFLFESSWTNFTDAGRCVSQNMATCWTNFVKSQDPSERLRVPLSWPRAKTENETYIYIQDPLLIN
ncbi:unnamed protein product [Rotaria socialis]|uniref:Carboxylesterase type B domain-containing protein n=1 Tax=Rotaria socialis TaxID=392032 RepID=A0A819AD68_9BILA|nr:unnamed protein product [Rotaria socialis]CAF3782514.1 unnamed protein product [Rotaria socialis]CAF4727678.1 unnamed protein product [Rotaria socialis]CAF4778131.1 unnamed protein product [Rotaria socialis]